MIAKVSSASSAKFHTLTHTHTYGTRGRLALLGACLDA